MKKLFIGLTTTLMLTACGVETATTAATAATLKKQELEQHKNTVADTKAKVDQAMLQGQQNTQQAMENAEKSTEK